MGWIKRNLIFVIGGFLALALLGGAGYFIYLGWSRNSEQSQKLNELYDKLTQINQSPQQPGDDKTDNVKAAKEQDQQLRDWIRTAAGRFQPVPPIPEGPVTSKTYASALGTTIYQLQQEAKENSVGLPANYYFSFQVQSSKLTISSGLGPLAQQLGEVKAIAEILFAARVNSLDGIQRVRVSDDDVSGGVQADYTDQSAVTNDLAIITPYVVTFQCFTPELAKVLSGFATATNPFIVKSLSVQPANASGLSREPGRERAESDAARPVSSRNVSPRTIWSRAVWTRVSRRRAARTRASQRAGQRRFANGFEGTTAPRHGGGRNRETAAQALTWTSSRNITKKFCSA